MCRAQQRNSRDESRGVIIALSYRPAAVLLHIIPVLYQGTINSHHRCPIAVVSSIVYPSVSFRAVCLSSEQRERLQAAIDDPDSLRLVVDLNWAESASGKELSSLVKQLSYVYGRAKASLMPPRLTLTSYQGRAAAALKRYVR